ncbi:MAG: BlaI/MecI/CopY family transcriptional regulator [Lachnospiraceae bacterium]|mgnify:FL=1
MKVTGSEWYVLECLWEEEPQTLMSIFTKLNKTQGWAKSTCATMLKRMEEKNLIRHEEKGRTKYFYTNTRRDEVAHKETRNFLNRIYNGSISMMMSALVAKNELSDQDISELEQILQKLKK